MSINKVQQFTVTMATTTTAAFVVGDYEQGSFQLPAAVTGTTWTQQVSIDGQNWTAVEDAAGNAKAASPGVANESIPFHPEIFNFKHARLVSNQTEAEARTITVFLKG